MAQKIVMPAIIPLKYIPKTDIDTWHVWVKVGDNSADNVGYKDGEIVHYQSAVNGNKVSGIKYGSGDLKSYAIIEITCTEEELLTYAESPKVDDLTTDPISYEGVDGGFGKYTNVIDWDGTAELKKRRCKGFLDLDTTFTEQEVIDYRDHKKEIKPKKLTLSEFSLYKDNLERLDKPFVHGSVSSGSYTIGGVGADYATLETFIGDIAGNLTGDLTGTVTGAHEVVASGNLSTLSNGGLGFTLTITSDQTKPGILGYELSTGDVASSWQISTLSHIEVHSLHFVNISIAAAAPVTIGSTAITKIHDIVVDGSTSAHLFWPWFRYFSSQSTVTRFDEYYNVLVINPPTSGGSGTYGMWMDFDKHTTVTYDSNMVFENCTIFAHLSSSGTTRIPLQIDTKSGATCTVRNVSVYNTYDVAARNPIRNTGAGTVHLLNCANKTGDGTSGTITSAADVDSVAGDFTSVVHTSDDVGKIDDTSALYNVGTTGLATSNPSDIMGCIWPSPLSIGTYSGAPGDAVAPYVTLRAPGSSDTGIIPNINVIFHVKDDGVGVDSSTIVLTVEGAVVVPAITGTSADYTVIYDPAANFDYSQVVNVTIDADDLNGTSMVQVIYFFVIEDLVIQSKNNITIAGDIKVRWGADNG